MTFNPHNNLTANGVPIVQGLAVFTNELEAGRVQSDDTSDAMCCERNEAGHTKPAQVSISGGWFSDHAAGGRVVEQGCYCRHDHWFTVATKSGNKSFNGERLATVFEGRKAETEV